MPLAILFHFLRAHHVSDISMSIIRSLRLCFSLQHGYHSNPTTLNLQHAPNQEQYDQRGNSAAQSQAPDDGHTNVWNMMST